MKNWRDVPVPASIRLLPRCPYRQFPILFTSIPPVPNWEPDPAIPHDFRGVYTERILQCQRDELCGICGKKLGYWIAFLGGPLSCGNRSFPEPPMHPECARYAVQVCPYMVVRAVPRRETGSNGMETTQHASAVDEKPPIYGLYLTRFPVPFGPSQLFALRASPHANARARQGITTAYSAAPNSYIFHPRAAKVIEWYSDGALVGKGARPPVCP